MQQSLQSQVNATPQLRVVLTPHCNLKCVYCRPGGEGYANNLHTCMTTEEVLTIINLCAKVGFTHVKFTGGEPFLRRDLMEIIQKTKSSPGIQEVQLVTNGTLLTGQAAKLRLAGLDWITVSLDAAEPDIFWSIRKAHLETVVSAIRECRDVGLPVRINMVVMKSNLNQIQPMIKLASELGCSLKLLDLICMDGNTNYEFSKKEFIHFDVIHEMLKNYGAEKIGLEAAPGGIGAPLTDYRMSDGLPIVVKDSTRGTYYHSSCQQCEKYPCQDALISVRVTHNGCLKRCLIRDDNLTPLLHLIRERRNEDVVKAIQETFTIMTESKFYPFAWKPEFLSTAETTSNG